MSLSLDSVGKRVAYARKYRSLTQQELASRAGIAQSSLAALEAGRNKGSRHLVGLAKALGVPPEWLDNGQSGGLSVQEMLLGTLAQDASPAERQVHSLLKQATLGEYSDAYQQTDSAPPTIGLKLLAWTPRSLLDPDTAYKQQLEQQRRFQWPFPYSARAFLLRSVRDYHIPNLREDDLLLIEPDVAVEAGRHVVVVRSDDEILLGRIVDSSAGQFVLTADQPGAEELHPLDGSMQVAGVIFSRHQRL